MAAKSVLMFGIEPKLVDYSNFPGLDAEKVAAGIKAQVAQLQELGYDADACMLDLGETSEAVATQRLKARAYDCIVLGAGLRTPPALFLLFEKIINIVHVHARQAKICFNTKPTDTVEAVKRWV
jgi:hypothetical protein